MNEQKKRLSSQRKLSQYLRQRKKFARNTIILALIFLLLTFAQWVGLTFIVSMRNYFTRHYWFALIFLSCTLLLILIFIFIGAIRFYKPWNIITALLIVECVVFGLAIIFTQFKPDWCGLMMMAAVTTLPLFVILHGLGLCIPRDLTLDVVVIFVCTIVFFTGSYFFFLISLFQNTWLGLLGFNLLLIAMLALFIMYHSQTIHGERYAEVRLKDQVLASLIMYFDFILLYLLVMMLVRTILKVFEAVPEKKTQSYY